MFIRSPLSAVLGLCLLILTAPVWASGAERPLRVVASFSILGDMVRQVGGDDVAVHILVGADGDAHGYQPSSADLKAVTGADVIFVNGLDFDAWMQPLTEAAHSQAPVVTATAGITPRRMTKEETHEEGEAAHHPQDHQGNLDPHAWQDLRNGLIYADNIAKALAKARPESSAAIMARAAAYKAQMKALDEKFRWQMAVIPTVKRVIITSHDAFGYFGAAYGIAFHAPQGISTESEPSAADIARVVDQIKQIGAKTVFIENMTSPRLIAQLGKDAGAKLGGTLYADALSAPGGNAPDYLGMFRHNLPLLLAAMRGE